MEPISYATPLPVRPGVITWLKVYCWLMCFLYLGVTAVSLVFFLVDPRELEMERLEAILIGTIFAVLGPIFLTACALPLVLKPRPWVWIYDLIIICLGLTSACFWPICIPLLIFWIKPETRAYFGKT